jgi:predicted amidohydrolase
MLRVALVQLDVLWNQPLRNLQRVAQLAVQIERAGAQLLVLPEMFDTGFYMQPATGCEPDDGPIHQGLVKIAQQHHLWVLAGMAQRVSSATAANVAAVYDAQGALHYRYVKNHPFPLVDEQRYFPAGTTSPFTTIVSIPSAVTICFDLRFPELYRPLAPSVQVIYVLANWPAARQHHWHALLQARAIENQCFVVGVNRRGTDGAGVVYAGGSVVFDPLGGCIMQLDADCEWALAELDCAQVAQVRSTFPFLPTN